MIVWVATQERGNSWEMIGVFESEELAIAACKEPGDMIAPLTMNAVAPRERTDWPDARYPVLLKFT